MLEEFKKFALKGNMVELAVAVIVGAAFSGLVNSIVNDLFMPIVGLVTGGLDFSNIYWQLVGDKQPNLEAARKAGATLAYGHFITLFINFMVVSFVMFLVIKGFNRLSLTKDAKNAEEKILTHSDIALDEIRALLKQKMGGKAVAAAAKTQKASLAKSVKTALSAQKPAAKTAKKAVKAIKKPAKAAKSAKTPR